MRLILLFLILSPLVLMAYNNNASALFLGDVGSWPTTYYHLPIVNVDCSKGLGGDTVGDGICANWKVTSTTGELYGLDIKFYNHTSTYPPVYNGTKNSDGDLYEYFLPCGGPGFSDGTFQQGASADRGDQCPSSSHKDIYVEYDAFQGMSMSGTAYNDLITSFASIPNSLVNNINGAPGGITLHLEWGEDGNNFGNWGEYNFNRDYLSMSAPYTQQGLFQLKDAWFGTPFERHADSIGKALDTTNCPGGETVRNCLIAKSEVYHYALFINEQLENPSYSGWSWIPGNSFIISLGGFSGGTGSVDQQEGAFMHELGHNLGLHHGGVDDVNGKPNYFSVMNAAFEFRSTYDFCRPLNYSAAQLSSLNQNSLNENVGVDPYYYPSNNNLNQPSTGAITACNNMAGTPRATFYAVPGTIYSAHANGRPIDWNNNGQIDTGMVSATINNIAGWGYPDTAMETLNGYNDWSNLIYNFRAYSNYYPVTELAVPGTTGHEIGMLENYSHPEFSSDNLRDSLRHHLTDISSTLGDIKDKAFSNPQTDRSYIQNEIMNAVSSHQNGKMSDVIKRLTSLRDHVKGEAFNDGSAQLSLMDKIDNALISFNLANYTAPGFIPCNANDIPLWNLTSDGNESCLNMTDKTHYAPGSHGRGGSISGGTATAQSIAATTVTLTPVSITPSSATIVSVSVAGTSPTGTVSFTVQGGAGSFSSNTCTLSSGSCSVTFTGTSEGSPTIAANYDGDTNNKPSSGNASLFVCQAAHTKAISNPSGIGFIYLCTPR